MISKVRKYIDRDIWRIPSRKMKGRSAFFLRTFRVFVLSFREFSSDQCSLWASALTFYSLLSIVPVFAMAFGLAKGFGLDKLLREKLIENAQGQQEIMTRIVGFSENFLQTTKGGLIAGVGLVLLFWTVIQVLTNIEQAFNHIWGIKKERTLGRKFTDYLALILIMPVFFIAASSATVFLVSQVETITEKIGILGPMGAVIVNGFQVLPLLVFTGLLTYLYIFLPNGKIHFKSALLGGMISGTVYQMVQWAYVRFQIGASNAGAVYGTFAALPLFLAWLQTSWMIVLYGAELAFAHQNEKSFEFEPDCLNASEAVKKRLTLRIMHVCVTRFSRGEPPLSAEEIAAELEMPIRLAQDILSRLTQANLLSVAQGTDERDRHYQPARDVGEMTLQFVIEKMERAGTADVPVAETPELEKLRQSLDAFNQAIQALPENLLLKDLSRADHGARPREKKSALVPSTAP